MAVAIVDPNHSLLSITLYYLKDDDSEHPSAQKLREKVAVLKETAQYKNATASVKDIAVAS